MRTMLVLLLLTACASAPARRSVDAEPPYTASAIRAATGEGRTYVFRVRRPGGEARRTIRFHEVDDEGAVITAFDDGGTPEGQRVTWRELLQHGVFPADRLRIEEGTVKVPAGRFACAIYRVRGDDGQESVFWFARDLPGAPVRSETPVEGGTEIRELESHDPGSFPVP